MSEEQKVYTTQQTAKKWKLVQIVGVAIAILAMVLVITSAPPNEWKLGLAAFGVVVMLFGRLMAWWHHG
jgi:protein-S-isoprenylcysteine O-methyltransferase Ste14